MTATGSPALPVVERGSHVCWIVDNDIDFDEAARHILAQGENEKRFVFGPEGGDVLGSLGSDVTHAVDPRAAFLEGGSLQEELMLQAFADQARRARDEGFDGIRLVADMEWLLATGASTREIVGFELRLDRALASLGATVVCAYRRRSFDGDTILGNLCVHPRQVGAGEPPFRFIAADDATWQLTGEVDLLGRKTFASVLVGAAGQDDCSIDATGLEYIDVAGMRALAEACGASSRSITVRGAPEFLRRCWTLAGFDATAPAVVFVP